MKILKIKKLKNWIFQKKKCIFSAPLPNGRSKTIPTQYLIMILDFSRGNITLFYGQNAFVPIMLVLSWGDWKPMGRELQTKSLWTTNL
jgi:hypothetical protein